MPHAGQVGRLELKRPVLGNVRSRLRRLGRMTLAEIADRGRQEAAKRLDRARKPWASRDLHALVGEQAPSLRDKGAVLRLLQREWPARFFAGVESAAGVDRLRSALPNAGRDLLERAAALRQGRLDILGHAGLEAGDPIDWHRDPVALVHAPLVHWTEIDLQDVSLVGDCKITWEINRHQWLVTLAQAWWLTGDARNAAHVVTQLQDWSRANPYGLGVNWASSLEVSYRLIAWCWTLALLRDAGACSDRQARELLARIWIHATHVERYLSSYSSPNTHLTGEALGLVYAGVLLPEFTDAGRWLDTGKGILVEESRRQVLADGVYFEQATCYQRYTIEIYLHLMLLAERNGVRLPADVRNSVERMVESLAALTHPDGSMPSIGDADGGWVAPLAARAPSDSRGVFAVAAACFGRADFAWAARGPAPEVAWLLGPAGVERFQQLHPAPPQHAPSRLLGAGGYAVMQSSWRPDAHQLIVDVGPLGCPYSSGHGHADLLSVQCHAFGEAHIVDPGTYCYVPKREWRDYFRGSASHSTVVVDGLGQADSTGPFAWGSRPAVTLNAWESSPDLDYLDAEHDGYTRLAQPVRHRRRVLFVQHAYWVVVDDFTGEGSHHVDVKFQFAPRPVTPGPGLSVSSAGTNGSGLWLVPFAGVPLTRRVTAGGLDPIDGWISRDYGRREPAPAVGFSTTSAMPLQIITLLMPVDRLGTTPPAVDAVRDGDGAIVALRVRDRGETIRVHANGIAVVRDEFQSA